MSEQNYKNHTRILPIWHFVGGVAIFVVFVASIVHFIKSYPDNILGPLILLLISIILIVIYWYARRFALLAQDRAIRAEENLRHYILTGKALDRRLHMGQIVALRFAQDEEFPTLAEKALKENLTNRQIKTAIKVWKPDHNRV
ncbi:MAG: hypothetical protein H7Y42_04380 [Chitinophagaceae bacterium]|nr:hypothetical protein [Chitinophagaceae bacterium]